MADGRREYYIGDEKTRARKQIVVRTSLVVRYRNLTQVYKVVKLHQQVFKIMQMCYDNDEYLTNGELVAILRKEISTVQPLKAELNHLKAVMFQLRAWVKTHGLVIYGKRKDIIKGFEKLGVQWIFEPTRNTKEYMKNTGNFIEKVIAGTQERHESNKTALRMTKRQRERMMQKLSEEIDREANLFTSNTERSKGGKKDKGKR